MVRLSVLQRFISARGAAHCSFFSESRHAAAFFNCPGILLDDDRIGTRQRWHLLEQGLRRAIDELQPDVLVCDTYWSEAVAAIAALRGSGGRAVLILRMTEPPLMAQRLRAALPLFDTVLLPHHPDEVRWTYRHHPDLVGRLASPPVVSIGPVCRVVPRPSTAAEVIFTVGAGGEWPDAGEASTIASFLRAYTGASRLLQESGRARPTLAAGTRLGITRDLEEEFDVIRTTRLHTRFGPETTVISRGGYNTVWEAIGAGSRVVMCGTRRRLDDIRGRSAFIQRHGLGRSVRPDARALFEAIVTPWEERSPGARRWTGIVNAGLELALDAVLGGSVLRAHEPAGDRAVVVPRMNTRQARLIAWFEDVDGANPSADLLAAARAAVKHGYTTRLCVREESGGISPRLRRLERAGVEIRHDRRADPDRSGCVPVLAWPGPRVRSELRIADDIAARRARNIDCGLSFHADSVPLFVSVYLLRLFSLDNG